MFILKQDRSCQNAISHFKQKNGKGDNRISSK